MKAVIEHIDHVCQLTGNCEHVAIGSDLDGGFGRETSPIDYDTIADLQKFLGMLERRGFSQADVARIAHGNLLNFFRRAWS
jgi:membrane dipeptidase